MRMSKDILELWESFVSSNINKFGDEKWLVYEQVYISALDCHNLLIAANCISALRAQYPKSIRVKKLIAMNFEAIGKFEKAEQRYEQILEEDETNAHVIKRKISCYKSQNKIKEYINELNDYLKKFQADHEAWLELCEAYLNEMEFSKAAFCLEELILMNPHNHVYHQKYADIKYTQGNFELARNYYSYSLKLNPNNIRSLYGILLATTNLKSLQKSKELSENSKLNIWAKEQLESKYKVSFKNKIIS
jgi:tetratricopeptide (TPR) repeat protein